MKPEKEKTIVRFGPEYSEKRDFRRMTLNIQFNFTVNGKTFTGFCKNLSHTGIQFVTDQSIGKEAAIEITIGTESSRFEPMKAKVEIIREELTDYNKYVVAGKIIEYK
ncbi:MAG: PilZ domain-containing protein [Nitrospiraceae bacterium]|nr:MAG: PilZ domain-containing protein [Nitrospiraceae bacterium]